MKITSEELDKLNYNEILMLSQNNDDDIITMIDLFYSNNRRYKKGVLNAILIHSIRLKKGFVPNLRYLEKVLKTWITNNRNTTKKALNYINQYLVWQSTDNPEKTKKLTVDKPEWLNEYIEEISLMKG